MQKLMLTMLLCTPSLWAQHKGANEDPIPAWNVDIRTSNGNPVSLPSMAMRKELQCRGGMCYGIFAVNPREGFEVEIAAFDLAGKSHAIDPTRIPQLRRAQVMDLAPSGDGGVITLLSASDRENKHTASYIAKYDAKGDLNGVFRLDLEFVPVCLASTSADRILMSGFDPVGKRSLVAVLNAEGQLVRLLDDGGTLPKDGMLLGASPFKIPDDSPNQLKDLGMASAVSTLTFGYAGSLVLLLNPGSKPEIWAIRGNEVSKKPLQMPKGVLADSIVSSDGAWLIRAFTVSTDSGMLLEFDPETGNLKRQVQTTSAPSTSIFYESNSEFFAVWWNDAHAFILKGS